MSINLPTVFDIGVLVEVIDKAMVAEGPTSFWLSLSTGTKSALAAAGLAGGILLAQRLARWLFKKK